MNGGEGERRRYRAHTHTLGVEDARLRVADRACAGFHILPRSVHCASARAHPFFLLRYALSQGAAAGALLGDARFKALFADEDFAIDEQSTEFRLLHPMQAKVRQSRSATASPFLSSLSLLQ